MCLTHHIISLLITFPVFINTLKSAFVRTFHTPYTNADYETIFLIFLFKHDINLFNKYRLPTLQIHPFVLSPEHYYCVTDTFRSYKVWTRTV